MAIVYYAVKCDLCLKTVFECNVWSVMHMISKKKQHEPAVDIATEHGFLHIVFTDEGDAKEVCLDCRDAVLKEQKEQKPEWPKRKIEIGSLSPSFFRQTKTVEKIKVYVMLDRSTGFYKIGRSKNPVFREKTLQAQKPTIDLLFSRVGTNNDEYQLQKRFESKRVRGEWFALDDGDLLTIKNYFKEQKA